MAFLSTLTAPFLPNCLIGTSSSSSLTLWLISGLWTSAFLNSSTFLYWNSANDSYEIWWFLLVFSSSSSYGVEWNESQTSLSAVVVRFFSLTVNIILYSRFLRNSVRLCTPTEFDKTLWFYSTSAFEVLITSFITWVFYKIIFLNLHNWNLLIWCSLQLHADVFHLL